MRARSFDTRAVAPASTPQRSTDEILRGVAGGERWAHVALYEALLPAVLDALRRVLRDPSRDYEDLVQTTFERVVRILIRDKQPPAANLPAWAAAIAAHVALDTLRARIRERKVFARELHDEEREPGAAAGPDVEGRLEARRQLLSVQGHLARMKAERAQMLVLHDVFGYDLVEAAALTGVSFAAAQKRLWRARAELLRRAQRGRGLP